MDTCALMFLISRQEVIQHNPVSDLSFVSLDGQDKKVISYITNSESTKLIMCHSFRVKAKVCCPISTKLTTFCRHRIFPLLLTMPFNWLQGPQQHQVLNLPRTKVWFV